MSRSSDWFSEQAVAPAINSVYSRILRRMSNGHRAAGRRFRIPSGRFRSRPGLLPVRPAAGFVWNPGRIRPFGAACDCSGGVGRPGLCLCLCGRSPDAFIRRRRFAVPVGRDRWDGTSQVSAIYLFWYSVMIRRLFSDRRTKIRIKLGKEARRDRQLRRRQHVGISAVAAEFVVYTHIRTEDPACPEWGSTLLCRSWTAGF